MVHWFAGNDLLHNNELDILSSPESTDIKKVVFNPVKDQWVRIIELVMLSQKPNKDGCRIRVNNIWNFELLSSLLADYPDKDVIECLRYGWPLDRDDNAPLEMGGVNHKGATEYPEHIDKYIQKEIGLGAIIGPFDAIPFTGQVGISPLSTREKRDSNSRCIIMDCSWPIGFSVNDGIDKDNYLGKPVKLKYPTVDMLVKHIFQLAGEAGGREKIFLYKEDMDRAFFQLQACLASVPKL